MTRFGGYLRRLKTQALNTPPKRGNSRRQRASCSARVRALLWNVGKRSRQIYPYRKSTSGFYSIACALICSSGLLQSAQPACSLPHLVFPSQITQSTRGYLSTASLNASVYKSSFSEQCLRTSFIHRLYQYQVSATHTP